MKEPLKITEGMTLICDTLEWYDGWEFDHPSMMLSPVIRCFEDASNHEQIVEDVLIDAVCSKELKSQDFKETWDWRGYKLPVLKRRFKESLAGKKFPKAGYRAKREAIKIIKDEDGELTWETIIITED